MESCSFKNSFPSYFKPGFHYEISTSITISIMVVRMRTTQAYKQTAMSRMDQIALVFTSSIRHNKMVDGRLSLMLKATRSHST